MEIINKLTFLKKARKNEIASNKWILKIKFMTTISLDASIKCSFYFHDVLAGLPYRNA